MERHGLFFWRKRKWEIVWKWTNRSGVHGDLYRDIRQRRRSESMKDSSEA
jgi:hypothetical protein